MEPKKISEIVHPEYNVMYNDWEKYRYTFNGGHDFVDEYLEKFSTREDTTDFNARKNISYCPAHAKAAVIDIKNAIFQRMVDINRINGSKSWQRAIKGLDKGVDLNGNTMNGFMGRKIIPELLSMAKVGVYIDKSNNQSLTLKDSKKQHPYLYIYQTEDIRSWKYNEENELVVLLLRDHRDNFDEVTGLVDDEIIEYRLLQKKYDFILGKYFIEIIYYDANGKELYLEYLDISKIPCVLGEINHSLLTDVADYQIALLNLASADLSYAIKGNFPFYVEQYNPMTDLIHHRQAGTTGEASEATEANHNEINIGSQQGRRYPQGLDQPSFINPSPDPLKISMEKQEKMEREIRQLVNLALTNVDPKRASAESKEFDEHSLEAGLSYIGLELEYMERQITEIWSLYEGEKPDAVINYPNKYSLRSDDDRRKEAKELRDLAPTIPSITFQKTLAKQVAQIVLGPKISNIDLEQIYKEIDKAAVIVTDPDTIKQDFESGLLSTGLASKLRGYPEGEVEQAKVDHADRAARIALAQSKANQQGIVDMDKNLKENKE